MPSTRCIRTEQLKLRLTAFCARPQSQAIKAKHDPQRPAFTVSGDGKQVRDLLHVSDAVDAYVAACEHLALARGLAFNIGTA